MISQENCKILCNRQIADSIYELTLTGGIVSEMKQPGQFVHVKISGGFDPLLRRPISIASIDRENEAFTIIYRVQGRGTSLLAEKVEGEEINILGPLGNGFPINEVNQGQTAILIGGGVGVPPMFELAKQLEEKGVTVVSVLGFQTSNAIFYEKELARFGDVYVSTVDGSSGVKGFVTDVLKHYSLNGDIVFACGPTPMLRAIEAGGFAPSTYLSLEERMGCGIGACFACVCHTSEDPEGHTYKKVCTDGPVFAAGEVKI